jgi:phage/plasmid-associated DNA primase
MDNGGREAMLYDLLQYDYSKVNLREFPRTEALLDQMLHSASSIEKFWFEKLQESSWTERVAIEEFYDEYLDYCQKMGLKYPSDKRQFGKELRRLCPAMKRGRPALSDGSRQYEYAFPKIDECRLQFEQHVEISINWDES